MRRTGAGRIQYNKRGTYLARFEVRSMFVERRRDVLRGNHFSVLRHNSPARSRRTRPTNLAAPSGSTASGAGLYSS